MADKNSATKNKIRFLIRLCLVFCFVFLAFPAKSQPFGGLLTVSNINFRGGLAVIDSFDSSDPTKSLWQTNWSYTGQYYSTNTNNIGQYYGTYTNTLRSDDATVGTDTGNLIISNSTIYGYVDTAPGGTVMVRAGCSVGDLNWVGPNPKSPFNTGIQPEHQLNDMNQVFDDVVLPTPANTYYPTPTWLSPGYFPAGTNIGGQSTTTSLPISSTSPERRPIKSFGNWISTRFLSTRRASSSTLPTRFSI